MPRTWVLREKVLKPNDLNKLDCLNGLVDTALGSRKEQLDNVQSSGERYTNQAHYQSIYMEGKGLEPLTTWRASAVSISMNSVEIRSQLKYPA